MDYYPNGQNNQWPFGDQQPPQQASSSSSAATEWPPVQQPQPDAPDPFAALTADTSSQMFYPGFSHLASPSTQYASQQPFYPNLFDSNIAGQWGITYPNLNGVHPPASPSRMPSGQQQPQPSQALHQASTIDPAMMLQTYTHSIQPQLVLAQHQQHYPISVNPSLLHAQQQPKTLTDALKPLLASRTLESGARSAVNNIIDTIDKHGGPADVDSAVRLELMSRVRDNAGADFLKAWVNHAGAMELVRVWLKACIIAKDAGTDESNNALIALLYVLNRLPFTVELLKETKIGRYVKHLQKNPPTNAIKSVAEELEKNWLNIVRRVETDGGSPEAESKDDPRNRKRKLTETGASRDAPPAKKAATAGSTTKVIVKKETKAGTSTSLFTHAKSDSSFFSAPKAKPKLPSFKKAPAAAMATATPAAAVKQERNTAQPMSIDPFQDAMKSLNRGRFGSPVQSTPSSSTVPSASGSVTDPNKKPKKKVHFPPDGKDSLFFVRIVSRVVYDDDPNHDTADTEHNIRDYDRAEGAAMHKSLFQELIDWFEPPPLLLPDTTFDGKVFPLTERGVDSQEKLTQHEREAKSLHIIYISPEDIPPCPAEAPPALDEGSGVEPRLMLCGSELDELTAEAPTTAELLARLAVPAAPEPPVAQQPAALAASVDTESIQRFLQQMQQASTAQAPVSMLPTPTGYPAPAVPFANAWAPAAPAAAQSQAQYEGWNAAQQNYAQQSYAQPDEQKQWGGEKGWRGAPDRGRGRGAGRGAWRGKKKICNFFAAGKCRYGDTCDFLHERD